MDVKEISTLANEIRSGETRSIARGISLIENGQDGTDELLDELYSSVGRAYRIGITGSPGSGKSSLISALSERFIDHEQSVGVVAVDPSSPFTGGAILGDRVRMGELRDPLLFFRSMASRGTAGGIAPTTLQVCDVLDAAGKDLLLIETVGAGQSDVEVSNLVDFTVLVLTPDSGDSIQAMKAGLMEIGDLIVINKKDRGGADRVEQELRSILSMRDADSADDEGDREDLSVQIMQTSARDDENVDQLHQRISDRMNEAASSTSKQRRSDQQIQHQIDLVLRSRFRQEIARNESIRQLKQKAVQQIQQGELSPYGAVRNILRELGFETSGGPSNVTTSPS